MLRGDLPSTTDLDLERPAHAACRLSRGERERIIARACHSLYRWYLDRSQTKRNWNPDRSFDWRSLRRDHSPQLLAVIEGFYAVEQYAPDYTAELTRLVRGRYGRRNSKCAGERRRRNTPTYGATSCSSLAAHAPPD